MADSNRPIYVPRRKRRNANEIGRLHGAFTGGFSAGYFNSVGSAEGWNPSSVSSQRDDDDDDDENDKSHREKMMFVGRTKEQHKVRPKPRIEDYMDEQDHNEWGGPLHLKAEYKNDNEIRKGGLSKSALLDVEGIDSRALLDTILIKEPSRSIGNRFLRQLGWKGNDTAYTPNDDNALPDNNDMDDHERRFLSARNLRKIKIQPKRIYIPPPKLDTTGLGYSAFENAPEFEAHKEKRIKLAQQRTQASMNRGSRTNQQSNVYRISDVLQDDHGTMDDPDDDDGDDPNIAYHESIEDFVGKKSVGGFALQEDEDDAYDDVVTTQSDRRTLLSTAVAVDAANEARTSNKLQVNQNDYDLVAYEHSDSDPEDMMDLEQSKTVNKRRADVGSVLSSWATTGDKESDSIHASNNASSKTVTSDGRPLLSGFVLGSSSMIQQQGKEMRFRGPDIPPGYQMKPHVFADNEHPMVLQSFSRAVQLEVASERRKVAFQDAFDQKVPVVSRQQQEVKSTSISPPLPSQKPKSNAFVGLSTTMNRRFISETSSNKTDVEPLLPAGLAHPEYIRKLKQGRQEDTMPHDAKERSTAVPPESMINIKRTTLPFLPKPLLCKRFRVTYNAAGIHDSVVSDTRTREEAYFQDEIMARAAQQEKTTIGNDDDSQNEMYRLQAKRILQELLSDNEPISSMSDEEQRPPMSLYKSIFEPESESS